MNKNIGIIYYTDSEIKEPIASIVRGFILESGLPIVSCSLESLDFGKNIVLDEKRGYVTMVKQILTCLENLDTKYVFFCEHDVLYSKEYFLFIPPKDDIFYYNRNNWRWMFGGEKVIRYDRMLPLSCLCCNRELALKNYRLRMKYIEEYIDEFDSREPKLARRWGYEPGTKKKKRGGLTDDDFDVWSSEYPNIDIRHGGTFSPPKVSFESFRHKPKNWEELPVGKVEGWDLKKLFNL